LIVGITLVLQSAKITRSLKHSGLSTVALALGATATIHLAPHGSSWSINLAVLLVAQHAASPPWDDRWRRCQLCPRAVLDPCVKASP